MGAIFSRFNCLKAVSGDRPAASKPKAAPDGEDDTDVQPTSRGKPAAKREHLSSEPAPRTTTPEPKPEGDSQKSDTATPPTGVLAPAVLSSDTAQAPETDIAALQREDSIPIIIGEDENPADGRRGRPSQPVAPGPRDPRQPQHPPPRPPPSGGRPH